MLDRRSFYDRQAPRRARDLQRGYHRLLRRYYAFLVPPGLRVLELGCGLGDLLAAVRPSYGVGVDFSPAMIQLARQRHPHLHFVVAEATEFRSADRFDYILLADLINDVPDVQALLDSLHQHAQPHTRLVLNFTNNLWRPLLALSEKLGLRSPKPPQNWLALADVLNLLHLTGWEVIKTETRILWPMRTPLLAWVCNAWLAPLLKHLCLTIFVVARPRPSPTTARDYTVSVIIPVRNEAGNIEAAVLRTPDMGRGTELVFIEGHSTDSTWEELQRVQAKYPHRNIRVLKQRSRGKGPAVREAAQAATGEVLMILDGDLTVAPEELPKFYAVLRAGVADFVNGCRLVYPMEEEAMRFLNMVANKLFALAFSWLLGQPIKDTLCGTKALFRWHYELIAQNRAFFGDFDPFGDFDLLFGAAKLNLRIVELPVRYRARTYGATNIRRWRHGWLLLRMLLFGARRLKFFA